MNYTVKMYICEIILLSVQYREIENQHPSPSLLFYFWRLYHVGICDKREGSQTVREFAQMSVRDSRMGYR